MRMRMKGKLFIFLLAFILLYSFNPFDNLLTEISVVHLGGVPRFFRQFCQFLEDPLTGDEAGIAREQFKLRSVFVVTRHGERSPLHPHNATEGTVIGWDCSPYREEDRQLFDRLTHLLDSTAFGQLFRIDPVFKEFPRYPERSRCLHSRLTAEGALQHLRLGRFLRKKYSQLAWFDETNELQLALYSTFYARTFQSALSFIAGFLYPLRDKFSSSGLQLSVSNTTYFCMSSACTCENIKKLHDLFEWEAKDFFRQKYLLNGDKRTDLIDKARMVMASPQLEDPLEILDVLNGRHICRRNPLPCHGRFCLSYADANQAAKLASERATLMFGTNISTSSRVFRQFLTGESIGLLRTLTAAIRRLRRFPHTNLFRLFSGHDVTLRPLLFVLGIGHEEPPRYASRLIFESVEHSQDSLFIRVLYNGEDRTGDLSFCKFRSGGFCSARDFDRFVSKELFSVAGVNSMDEFCRLEV